MLKKIPYLIQYTKDAIDSDPEEWQDTQNWVSEMFKRDGWWPIRSRSALFLVKNRIRSSWKGSPLLSFSPFEKISLFIKKNNWVM